MTTTTSAAAIGSRLRRRPAPIAVAVLAGIALGAVDLLGQRALPYPWADLANSSAVWAVAAWAIGVWVLTSPRASATAGTVLLAVGVESYYILASVTLGDSWANLASPTATAWLIFSTVAGVVFGVAGSWRHSSRAWRRVLGAAVPVSVLLAEAALHLHHGMGTGTGGIELVLGVVLLVLIARRPVPAAQIALACLPITLVGTLALTAFGFRGFGG